MADFRTCHELSASVEALQPDAKSPYVAQSWIKLAVVGDFAVGPDGETPLLIASNHLREIQSNFRRPAYKRPIIDLEHMSTKRPEDLRDKTGGQSYGLIVDMRAARLLNRHGQEADALEGLVKWNRDGADILANARYPFISPTFAEHHIDAETAADVGAYLYCAAFTAHPFLDMPEATLSARKAAKTEASDKRDRFAAMLARKGMGKGKAERIAKKCAELPPDEEDGPDVAESILEALLSLLDEQKPAAVEPPIEAATADATEPPPVAEPDATNPQPPAEQLPGDPKEDEMDEKKAPEAVAASARPADGEVVTLRAELNALRATAEAAQRELGEHRKSEIQRTLDEAVKACRLTPPEVEPWRELAMADFARFGKLIALRIPVIAKGEQGTSADVKAPVAPTTIEAAMQVVRTEQPALTYDAALSLAERRFPQAFDNYNANGGRLADRNTRIPRLGA